MFLGVDLVWCFGDVGDEEWGEEGEGLWGEDVEVCWKWGCDGGEEGVGEGGVGCGEGEEGEEDDDGGCCWEEVYCGSCLSGCGGVWGR